MNWRMHVLYGLSYILAVVVAATLIVPVMEYMRGWQVNAGTLAAGVGRGGE